MQRIQKQTAVTTLAVILTTTTTETTKRIITRIITMIIVIKIMKQCHSSQGCAAHSLTFDEKNQVTLTSVRNHKRSLRSHRKAFPP